MYQKVKSKIQLRKEYLKQGKDKHATAQALGISLSSVYRLLSDKKYTKKPVKKIVKKEEKKS